MCQEVDFFDSFNQRYEYPVVTMYIFTPINILILCLCLNKGIFYGFPGFLYLKEYSDECKNKNGIFLLLSDSIHLT